MVIFEYTTNIIYFIYILPDTTYLYSDVYALKTDKRG